LREKLINIITPLGAKKTKKGIRRNQPKRDDFNQPQAVAESGQPNFTVPFDLANELQMTLN